MIEERVKRVRDGVSHEEGRGGRGGREEEEEKKEKCAGVSE